MKKITILMLIVITVLYLCSSAFAATVNIPSGGVSSSAPSGVSGVTICNTRDDTFFSFVPDNDVVRVPFADAKKKLDKRDYDAFLNAYNSAKDLEKKGMGRKVTDAYWFYIPDKYFIDESHYAKFLFTSAERDVGVTVNGHPMEVISITGRTSYYAKITELGTVLILSGPEPDYPEPTEEPVDETDPAQVVPFILIDS